ncbi:MAG: hypothetical protein L7W40_11820 [Akkermansiaceae bacterium]|nr:hypothetical protein [Akkermansiaceae bacterium]
MTSIQGLLTLLVICLCSSLSHAIELSDPAIHEVRAYVYDYTQEKKSHITIDGRLHRGVINKAGVKLSPNQLKRLLKAIAEQPLPKKILPLADCYWPHHGFVFFDKMGQILAHAEVCLQCNQHRGYKILELSYYWDLKDIRKLIGELKLPIFEDDKKYTQLFLKAVS